MDAPLDSSSSGSRSPSHSRREVDLLAVNGSSSSLPEECATPEPCIINAAEQLLLDAAKDGDGTQAFKLLEDSQVRLIPASMTMAELKPPACLVQWGMTCFDVCQMPATWASKDMCHRCAAINHLMRDTQMSCMTQCLLGTALATTDCESRKLSGTVPSLPLEIVVMIMDYYMTDLKLFATVNLERNSAFLGAHEVLFCKVAKITLCDMLHSSSFLRSRVAASLPMPLVHIPLGKARKGRTGPAYNFRYDNLHKALTDFVPKAVEWFVKDIATKRHASHPLVLPNAIGNVVMGKNKLVHTIKWIVKIVPMDSLYTVPLESPDNQAKTAEAERTVAKLKSQPLTVRNACEVLTRALSDVMPPPRILNPYHRVVHGDNNVSGAIVDVTMELPEHTSTKSRITPKHWKFRVFSTLAGADAQREKNKLQEAQQAQRAHQPGQAEPSPSVAPEASPVPNAAPAHAPAIGAPQVPAAPAAMNTGGGGGAGAPATPSPPGSPQLPPPELLSSSSMLPDPPVPPPMPPPPPAEAALEEPPALAAPSEVAATAPGAGASFALDPALGEDASDPTAS